MNVYAPFIKSQSLLSPGSVSVSMYTYMTFLEKRSLVTRERNLDNQCLTPVERISKIVAWVLLFFFLKFVTVKRHSSEFSEDQQLYNFVHPKLCFKSLISDSSLLFRILKCEPWKKFFFFFFWLSPVMLGTNGIAKTVISDFLISLHVCRKKKKEFGFTSNSFH